MTWLSTNGTWQVDVHDFGDFAAVEITRDGTLVWCGCVHLWHAHSGISAALKELGAPPLEDMLVR